MRIGMLTGGGDCPALNAVIRAVVRSGIDDFGDELVGFRDGGGWIALHSGVAGGADVILIPQIPFGDQGCARRRGGMMTSLQGNEIKLVTLDEAVAEVRRVPTEEYESLGVLFG